MNIHEAISRTPEFVKESSSSVDTHRRRIRLRNRADIVTAQQLQHTDKLILFGKLPIGEQLQQALAESFGAKDKDRKKIASKKRNIAMRNVLTLSNEERAKSHLRTFVVAPLDKNHQLALEDAEFSQYDMYVRFQQGGKSKFLTATRRGLTQHAASDSDALREVDTLVERLPLVAEEPIDSYKRTMDEIKYVDLAVRKLLDQKRRKAGNARKIESEIIQLISKKNIFLLSYLEYADLVLTQRPQLQLLYSVTQDPQNTSRITFAMGGLLPYDIDSLGKRKFTKSGQLTTAVDSRQLKGAEYQFKRWRETEENGAAVAILERLTEMGIIVD